MRTIGWLLILVLTSPLVVAAWVSFSPDAVLTPPTGEWSTRWYEAFAADRRWPASFGRSLLVAGLSTLVSLAAGVPAAAALARYRFRGDSLVGFLAILPAGVPPVALAVGFLPAVFAAGGWGALWPLVVAHGALGLPVVVLVVRDHLTRLDSRLEPAARGLGATRWQAFRRVTLPVVLPGVLAAAAAAFVLSANEAVVSVFLSTPRTETLPAVAWPELRYAVTPKVAVAAVLNGALAVVAALAVGRRG